MSVAVISVPPLSESVRACPSLLTAATFRLLAAAPRLSHETRTVGPGERPPAWTGG